MEETAVDKKTFEAKTVDDLEEELELLDIKALLIALDGLDADDIDVQGILLMVRNTDTIFQIARRGTTTTQLSSFSLPFCTPVVYGTYRLNKWVQNTKR